MTFIYLLFVDGNPFSCLKLKEVPKIVFIAVIMYQINERVGLIQCVPI